MPDIFECAVCLDIFQTPRSAPCGHTFCHNCIQSIVDEHDEDVFRCPLCKVEHHLPTNGVTGFTIIFVVQDGIDRRCVDCKRQDPVAGLPDNICQQCFHKRHIQQLQGCQEEMTTFIVDNDSHLQQLNDHHTKLMSDIEKRGEHIIRLVKEGVQHIKDDAEEKFNKVIDKWRDDSSRLKSRADQIIQNNTDVDTETPEETVRDLLTACQDQCNQLRDLASHMPLTDSMQLTYNSEEDNCSIENMIGHIMIGHIGEVELVLQGRPRVKLSRGTGPDQCQKAVDVCESPSREILVADKGNRRVLILNGEDQTYLREFKVTNKTGGQSKPYRMHITCHKQIIISTLDQKVVMFTIDGQYQNELVPLGHNTWERPHGITSDQSCIYICDYYLCVIGVFGMDGSFVRNITTARIRSPSQIACFNEQLVVSDGHTLHFITKDGVVLRTIDRVMTCAIQGLAATLECVYVSSSTDPITVIDKYGLMIQHVGELDKGSGTSRPWCLKSPRGITVTHNKLLVANCHNNNILEFDLKQ